MIKPVLSPQILLSLRTLLASPLCEAGDWWLIGSTAARLSGAELVPEDIDVFGSSSAMTAIVTHFGGAWLSGTPGARFRSQPFCRLTVAGGLPIEVMGDLEVKSGEIWQKLRIHSRIAVATEAGTVYIPSLDEQIAIFELFGRDKDLAKAAILRRMQEAT